MSSRRPQGLQILVGVGAVLLGFGCSQPPPPPPKPPEVVAAAPTRRDVTVFSEFTGNTAANGSVEIRARVQGVLQRQHYEPGSFVEKGQLLFEIEREPFVAARDQAEADVQSFEAFLRRAQSDLERLEQAVKTNAVSQQEVTRARAERDQAQANLLAAKSRLVSATIDLEYTRIHSPTKGIITRWLVDPGNLVGRTEATKLAEVRDINPIHVYFEVNEQLVSGFLDQYGGLDRLEGIENEDAERVYVTVDGVDRVFEGWMDYIDPYADPDTGTLQVRAVLPNDEGRLLPGFFVRIRVPGRRLPGALLVPETALSTDLGGRYLMIVDEDGLAQKRYVEPGHLEEDQMRVILEGLEADERYITEGLQRARPGMPVTVASN